MTSERARIWAGLFLVIFLFALGAKAQQKPVNQINTASGILANGGTSGTGPTVSLSIAPKGIANSSLANSSVTIGTSSGLSGGGLLSLGSSLTLGILPGGIANSSLANSSVNIGTPLGSGLSGGGSISLGGSLNLGLIICGTGQTLQYGAGWGCGNAGSGTVTSVGSGLGLAGGPITSSGTLSIDTSVVPQLGVANTFGATQTISSGNFALPATSSGTSGVITLGGQPFLHDYPGNNYNNTFVGLNAGNFTISTFGQGNNTGVGFAALGSTTTAVNNTATGASALSSNTTGGGNTANGANALFFNIDGQANTASGASALYANTGSNNTAIGFLALGTNRGNSNIGIGYEAGYGNVIGSNNIEIGNAGTLNDSGTIRIGTDGAQTQTFIAGIYGNATVGGSLVYVDSNGTLGTLPSSRRFKYDIENMGDASSDLMKLRPVTFRYKQAQADGSHPLQYGLVAEEVADVDQGLVAFDKSGEPQTVLYQFLPAMLLNEFQKQQQKIETQQQVIQFQQEQLKALEERLRKLETLTTKGN